jgi:hypothetical protein
MTVTVVHEAGTAARTRYGRCVLATSNVSEHFTKALFAILFTPTHLQLRRAEISAYYLTISVSMRKYGMPFSADLAEP